MDMFIVQLESPLNSLIIHPHIIILLKGKKRYLSLVFYLLLTNLLISFIIIARASGCPSFLLFSAILFSCCSS